MEGKRGSGTRVYIRSVVWMNRRGWGASLFNKRTKRFKQRTKICKEVRSFNREGKKGGIITAGLSMNEAGEQEYKTSHIN